MIREKIKTKNTLASFTKSILKVDLKRIESLLSEDGCYDAQDSKLETIEVGKYEFLSWLKRKFESSSILSVDIDQCLHCEIGNSVLLINNGEFPRKIKDISERSKTGLMIKTKDGLITKIKFCYVFAKTENKCVFELKYKPDDDWEKEII